MRVTSIRLVVACDEPMVRLTRLALIVSAEPQRPTLCVPGRQIMPKTKIPSVLQSSSPRHPESLKARQSAGLIRRSNNRVGLQGPTPAVWRSSVLVDIVRRPTQLKCLKSSTANSNHARTYTSYMRSLTLECAEAYVCNGE